MREPIRWFKNHFSVCALVVCLSLSALPSVWAHSVSETLQFSHGSRLTSLTSLQFDLFDEFSLTGTFTSTPMGGDLLAEYFTWDGWIARASFTYFVEEGNITIGGGHSQILAWDDGEWGLTADFGRSVFYFDQSMGVSRNQASAIQWQEEVSMLVNWGYGWDATLNFTLFQYNIKVDQVIQDVYEEWLTNRRRFDLVLGEFLNYLLSGSIGYNWESLGYTGLVLDFGQDYDYERFLAARVIWGKEIFEPISLMLSGQVSNKGDRLVSATVSVNF